MRLMMDTKQLWCLHYLLDVPGDLQTLRPTCASCRCRPDDRRLFFCCTCTYLSISCAALFSSHTLDVQLTLLIFYLLLPQQQHERTRITERQHKREIHFANRKFVLKA